MSDETTSTGSGSDETLSTGPIVKTQVIDKYGRAYGTGKRKTSIARVWIKEGSGHFVVNDKLFSDYFQSSQRQEALGAELLHRKHRQRLE